MDNTRNAITDFPVALSFGTDFFDSSRIVTSDYTVSRPDDIYVGDICRTLQDNEYFLSKRGRGPYAGDRVWCAGD
jgi:hypothetical protein